MDLKRSSRWMVQGTSATGEIPPVAEGCFVSVCVYVQALVPSHVVSAMQQTLCCVMQTKN